MEYVSDTLELKGRVERAERPTVPEVLMNYWKVFCMEKEYPGLWQRCFKNQCVAVGWSPKRGNKMYGTIKDNRGWTATRNSLKQIQAGDWIMVQLKNHR